MSLSLVQEYSSEEDEETPIHDSDDSNPNEGEFSPSKTLISRVHSEVSKSPKASMLPSPEDLFLEVTGPPEFLKSTSTELVYTRPQNIRQSSQGVPFTSIYKAHLVTDPRQIPPGIVFETKAKLVDLHKQVQGGSENLTDDTKDGAHPTVPRPVSSLENNSATETEKRSRSKIKDKERNKRMKGQSSHATWKSETEMHLRQQFD